MIIEYSLTEVFTKQLEISDVGNFALRCSNDKLVDYYMIVKTVLGKTSIFKFGPVISDLPEPILDGFAFTYKKMNYKAESIERDIEVFVNEKKKEITTVEEISEHEATLAFPKLSTALAVVDDE